MCTKIDNAKDALQVGSMNYIAPEVLDYKPGTAASDIWSTMVVIYTLFVALLPFDGDSYSKVRAQIDQINIK